MRAKNEMRMESLIMCGLWSCIVKLLNVAFLRKLIIFQLFNIFPVFYSELKIFTVFKVDLY
jgi:hypothetical protein